MLLLETTYCYSHAFLVLQPGQNSGKERQQGVGTGAEETGLFCYNERNLFLQLAEWEKWNAHILVIHTYGVHSCIEDL